MENYSEILEGLLRKNNLSENGMTTVMQSIMDGELSQAQLAAFLLAMRVKGITAVELSSAAQVMRSLAVQVEVTADDRLIDTCGSGGDGIGTFNISTAAAFVAAAGGAKVAKHGNKAVSSSSGSADLLIAAGANLDLAPEQIAEGIDKLGFGFIFAPMHHQAMKHVAPVRQELKIRTMFNMLGPLTNPASCRRQIIGIFSQDYLRLYAETLQKLGSEHVLVVHSAEGLDEISNSATTYCAELKNGKIREFMINPKLLGLPAYDLELIKSTKVEDSLAKVRQGLAGTDKAAAAIIAANAGAALYVAGKATTLTEGVAQAKDIIAEGTAAKLLQEYVDWSNSHNQSIDIEEVDAMEADAKAKTIVEDQEEEQAERITEHHTNVMAADINAETIAEEQEEPQTERRAEDQAEAVPENPTQTKAKDQEPSSLDWGEFEDNEDKPVQ
ncbi:MAG: anthranilate phosphoribosyltransferase [Gammaproteobacteria bacterium]|nr:anthranilate phosphoribosyltransferase [Gammaproteobacteria bacterium]